ncbi:MAG: metallophosphoesterase [Bacteroidales bacterium]
MFFTLVGSGILVMSLYVGWRLGSVPWLARRLPWWVRAVLLLLLGSAYITARSAERAGWPATARVLETVGAHWIGVLLLLFVAMLAGDILTGFGFFLRRRAAAVRGCALMAGIGLVILALVQGHRAPVVRDYELRLAGLAPQRDGTVIVFISDLHLGSLLGEAWLNARVAQIAALRADAIVVGGDILEGDSASESRLVPLLGRLSAPLGVWAVPGNHEYHGGGAASLQSLETYGFHVLRSEWKELAPGLVLAGIDNGRERHDQRGSPPLEDPTPAAAPAGDPLARALAGRPASSTTILVSHMPARADDAARAGVGLMLSGHTHDGQIWPFRYVVGIRFRYLAGRYDVAGMPLIVCRGTGTFGPRMRLWYPSEIVRVTLRSPDIVSQRGR